MKINVLSPEVYNRIAAGEVVDRPYSVVKELVENAIDSGASEITVEIEEGGKKLIRVRDNGCGIERGDLKNAFSPHATSKLRTAEDLFGVTTLGFRGEAIASIAAVSRMRIVSRTAGAGAYALSSEGGALGEVEEAAGADGTEVTVEDLFFNTPARKKFLKSDAQEEGDATGMMARFILSRPNVSFTYLIGGKRRFRSFGDGLDSALAVVYGADILKNCYAIKAERNGLKLSGYIGNQNFPKPNRSYGSLFINGRYVVNQTVSAAVMNAYQSYLMKRQFPFYVLFLDVPPEIVDVNVHPNKADVRFADNQVVYGCVYTVISSVLDGNSRALEFLAGVPSAEIKSTLPPSAPLSAGAAQIPAGKPQMSYERAKRELGFDVSPVGGSQPILREPARNMFEVHDDSASASKDDVFLENKKFLEERGRERIDPDLLEYRGSLFDTYLFYEAGDCAYLVDQHAAHERIIYDRLQQKLKEKKVVSQPMLLPFLLETNAQEFAFLSERLGALEELGFGIEEFGGTSFKVSAVPLDLFGMDLRAFFGEVLSSMDTLRAIRLGDLLKDKLASAACKAAVKGGDRLGEGEIAALLKEMKGDMGLKCPHGRPVAVKLARSEIEKLFKRIV